MPLRGLLLIAFFVASLPVCFFRPFYGLVLWTIVAFVNPQSYTWSAASFPWAQAVAIPTIAGALVFGRSWSWLTSRETVLTGVLWLWFTVTSFVSTGSLLFMHHAAETWDKWEFVSKVLLMAVLTIPIVGTLQRLRVFLYVIAGCFGLFVVKSFPFVLLTGGAFRLYGPPNSMIADNNDFGLALNMTLPIYYYLALTETRRWLRRLCGAMFVITIPAVFFTYSRGAMVGLVIVSLVMLLQSKRRLLLVPVVALGLMTALILTPEQWRERMDPMRSDAVDGSARARLNAWTFAWNLASEHPITGGGFATFTPELFAHYGSIHTGVYGAHSAYFQVLGEHGFVGLFLYLALVLSCLATTFSLARQALARGDDLVRQYCGMLRLSMVAFLVSGAFLGRAYFDYFFCLVACVSVLRQAARQEWAQALETHDGKQSGQAALPGHEMVLEA